MNDKICAVCGQPIRDGEPHSRMGRGVGATRYRHGHTIGDLRPCVDAAIARAERAEAAIATERDAAAEAELASVLVLLGGGDPAESESEDMATAVVDAIFALRAERDALRAERDAARGIETAEQPPEVGQRVQIIITADFVHGGFEPVADNRLFLPRHMAPFWRPLWAGTERGYEVHVMTGSTSAGRRQRDAGKE